MVSLDRALARGGTRVGRAAWEGGIPTYELDHVE
jgi:hypothetical protein